jgi:hypothetical protein
MTALKHVPCYRDFVFVKLGDGGPDFESYFGDALRAIDNLVDRSPVGRCASQAACCAHRPLQLEDVPGEHQRHGASAVDARVGHCRANRCGRPSPPTRRKPMAMEQILPFGAGYDFFDKHGRQSSTPTGTACSASTSASTRATPRCRTTKPRCAQRTARRARAEILERSPQNALCFPSLALKGSPQAIRVIRPLAADRTLIEAWSFRVEARPTCCSSARSPTTGSCSRRCRWWRTTTCTCSRASSSGLRADGNEWVSLHRGFDRSELEQTRPPSTAPTSG